MTPPPPLTLDCQLDERIRSLKDFINVTLVCSDDDYYRGSYQLFLINVQLCPVLFPHHLLLRHDPRLSF